MLGVPRHIGSVAERCPCLPRAARLGVGQARLSPQLLAALPGLPGDAARARCGTDPWAAPAAPGTAGGAGGCPPERVCCKGQEKMAVGTIGAGGGAGRQLPAC